MTETVENHMLKPDAALPLTDRTRVKLTIGRGEAVNQAHAAWNRLPILIDQHPIVGLAGRCSRYELFERD